MAAPSEKLAESLQVLGELQNKGAVAIHSEDLPRIHRERLLKGGFLREVIRGWYITTRPDESAGESTAWYASFWEFCAAYLHTRFGTDWCLSPEQSLLLHVGNRCVPRQLLVRAPKASNKPTPLLHNTSLLDVRATMPAARDIAQQHGLRLYKLPAALVACGPGFYRQYPTDAQVGLAMVSDASDVLDRLLAGGHSKIAGRLAAAFRNIGRERIGNDIIETMRAAGYSVREENPFEKVDSTTLSVRERSPYVNRLRVLWESMRTPIIERFPAAPGLTATPDAYLAHVEDIYVADAYHSLSIEGYRVTANLIERVRGGNWNPDGSDADRQHRDALAARGYWQASQAVRRSLERVLRGQNAGTVADEDHGRWYREMFAPSVTAGLIQAADLAGYRNDQVYIRQSMHVPPRREAIRDMMPAYFDLLTNETEPSVRVVLGHFVFVYIHPYMDGNGRIGRLLMNLMLASGGYPWTVIPLEQRDAYLTGLEAASVRQDIAPFAEFLGGLVKIGLSGGATAKPPSR